MQVKNLVKNYKLKSGVVEALRNISFDLADSGMVFVLGKSGSGKSTLLNVLSGMDSFDEGDIIFHGKSLKGYTAKEYDDHRSNHCGFVFQEYNLIPELNVEDNIGLALDIGGDKEGRNKIGKVLKLVGLEGYEKRKVTELSGGQKQRIAIARAIIKEPEIIFADEPSGALDSETGGEIFGILKELSKEKLVIVVTHDRESAERYGDRIIELSDGKIKSDSEAGYKAEEKTEDEKKPKKSAMPIKFALKIGCGNFKYHPIRFAVTVGLALFSFSFFALTFVFMTYNKVDPYVNAIYKQNVKYITIQKYQSEKPQYEDQGMIYDEGIQWFLTGDSYALEKETIDEAEFEYFQTLIKSEELSMVVSTSYYVAQSPYTKPIPSEKEAREIDEYIKNAKEHISSTCTGYMYLSQKELDKLGYGIVGRLPQSEDEIAITESCFYNVFGEWDSKNKRYVWPSFEEVINGEEQLVSLKDFDLKLTGVVLTGCSNECYHNNHDHYKAIIREGQTIYQPTDKTFDNIDETLFHSKAFVTKKFIFDNYLLTYTSSILGENETQIFVPVPQNKSEFRTLAKAIINLNRSGINTGGLVYRFTSTFSQPYYDIRSVSACFVMLCAYIGFFFLIFTVVFLLNFITASIRGQMKQIGIISAMGMSYKDIFKIYGLSAGILCGIVYVLSMTVSGIMTAWLNARGWEKLWFHVAEQTYRILTIGPTTFIIMFIIAMVTALLGTFLSLHKIRKLSPSEIIRRGQIK